MNADTQKIWVEKTISAVNVILPDDVEFKDWQNYERLLPNALTCAKWITDLSINKKDVARLLDRIAVYLKNAKADYEPAILILTSNIPKPIEGVVLQAVRA
ncbi:MAG: hypothetical protein GQ582_08430 [Methyloprofundus sp.]|nr:hypothetical protein [Methyloprofundus sp.]